jgi:PAS domain S-box-containing protein
VEGHSDDGALGALERALRERVKELETLRAVQLAIETAPDLDVLRTRVVEAMIVGMQFPELTRVELYLDGIRTVSGATGPLATEAGVDLVVAGRVRGRLVVGYVEPRSLLEPEEPQLVESVARTLGLHLELIDARAASAASVRRLRRVLEGLPSAVFLVDRERRVEVVTLAPNFPLRRIPDETFRLDIWEDPGAERLRVLVDGAFDGKPARREVEWRDSWWDLRVEPQRGDDEQIDHVLVMVLDVTEHRRRRELEAHLATLVGSANLAMVGLTPDGVVSSWNRGAVELFGRDAPTTAGRPIAEVAPDSPALHDVVRDVGAGRMPTTSIDLVHRRDDGVRLHAVAHVSPIRDVVGVVTGVLVVVEDRTDREQAERALAASEEQLRIITDALGDVVYRMALDPPRLEYVSPSSARVLGFAPAELVADLGLVRARTHPGDRARVLVDPGPEAAAPEAVRWRWQHADGRWVWVEDNRRVLVRDGMPIALVGVIRDVTDEQRESDETREALDAARRVAEELRSVDQMKTTFLSAVSHELRTPLTSVVGFAETVLRLTNDPSVSGMLERLVANALRLEGLVDDLLDVDRLTRGQIVPDRTPTDLAELVRRIVRRAEGDAHPVEVALEPVVAAVDAVMIERVVDNLLRNIHRHTPTGTRAWVSLVRSDGQAVLVVADNGPGVPERLRQRVFEPFTQGPHTERAASPGTGIGLSLVQRFVEVHDGVVVLDERPGGGARFTVRLPCGASSVEDGAARRGPALWP